MVKRILFLIFFVNVSLSVAQTDILKIEQNGAAVDTTAVYFFDANKPSKAAFYSAILPGLGQAYNKKLWKVPIVYGALGTGVYFYIRNDKQYDRLRDAFKIRLAGGTNDEFSREDGTPIISTLGLERAQRISNRNKETSLLITAGLYLLQIIEANIDAHLSQFNVDRNLSVNPYFEPSTGAQGAATGLSLNLTF